MIKEINTTEAPAAIGPYSQAKLVNNTLYLSGQIPLVPGTGDLNEGSIAEQTEQVISNISQVLKAGGSDISRVFKTTCYLKNMNDFAVFNEVYGKHFVSKPARTTVEVSALPKGALVEIEVIAMTDN